MFLVFPSASLGVGLLVLRLLLSVCLIVEGIEGIAANVHSASGSPTMAEPLGMLVIVCGMLVAVGFLTPAIQVFVVVLELGALGDRFLTNALIATAAGVWQARAAMALMGATLALTGPGAYSVDAHLFGWREINIPPRRSSAK